jgi:response regulator of citrate/malate metabolism
MNDASIKAVIVEDDPMVAEINSRYLKKVPGLNLVGVFSNGQKALTHLLESPADLVILDVYMPELSGLELLRAMRREGLKSEVIMVTAANDAKLVDELLKLGVADYLVKPFTESRFIEALEKCQARIKTVYSGDELSQQAIDRLMGGRMEDEPKSVVPPDTPKGLQPATLETVQRALAGQKKAFRGCEELAAEVGLSKVTVRRYLNHLAEKGLVESVIDYDTGGRPSVKYRLR